MFAVFVDLVSRLDKIAVSWVWKTTLQTNCTQTHKKRVCFVDLKTQRHTETCACVCMSMI